MPPHRRYRTIYIDTLLPVARQNPQDDEASRTLNAESAWGVLFAQRKNDEISDAAFRRQRRHLLVLMIVVVTISAGLVLLRSGDQPALGNGRVGQDSTMGDEMRVALQDLLDDLEEIGETHEELYDTDVREQMAETIVKALIPELGVVDSPEEFGMFSDEGNAAVRRALTKYLAVAVPAATTLGLDRGARLSAVWDLDVTSTRGTTVDEFLGSID